MQLQIVKNSDIRRLVDEKQSTLLVIQEEGGGLLKTGHAIISRDVGAQPILKVEKDKVVNGTVKDDLLYSHSKYKRKRYFAFDRKELVLDSTILNWDIKLYHEDQLLATFVRFLLFPTGSRNFAGKIELTEQGEKLLLQDGQATDLLAYTLMATRAYMNAVKRRRAGGVAAAAGGASAC